MIKTIDGKKIEITLEPHKAFAEKFEQYIQHGLEIGKHGADFYWNEEKIGSWKRKVEVKKGWTHKYFQMCTDFYIRY